jgi:hypothetical protein
MYVRPLVFYRRNHLSNFDEVLYCEHLPKDGRRIIFVESQPTFRRNMSPPYSGSKKKHLLATSLSSQMYVSFRRSTRPFVTEDKVCIATAVRLKPYELY